MRDSFPFTSTLCTNACGRYRVLSFFSVSTLLNIFNSRARDESHIYSFVHCKRANVGVLSGIRLLAVETYLNSSLSVVRNWNPQLSNNRC